ncbi:MAG TPA: DUF4381 family protein [Polyangia bacterium]|nr:DUF4381 family protein [Polyangia bacterium]
MRPRLWLAGLAFALLALLRGADLRAAPAAGVPAASTSRPAEDIRDIHGPIAPAPPRPLWPYLTAAGAVAAAGAAFALRRRRQARPASPGERALRALAEARSRTAGDARGFSFNVSEIVRLYVEEAFTLRAAHRTTEELLADLMRDASPVAAHRAELGEFLRYCDLAKFAGWSLSPAEMTSMVDSAETFVRATSTTQPTPAGRSPRARTGAAA